MKVSVEGLAPFARELAISVVEAVESHKIRCLRNEKTLPTTVVFEVDAPEEELDKVLELVKKAIKGSEKGRMLSFRVVPTGSLVYFKR